MDFLPHSSSCSSVIAMVDGYELGLLKAKKSAFFFLGGQIVAVGNDGTTRANRAVAGLIVGDNAVVENHLTTNRDPDARASADGAITEADFSAKDTDRVDRAVSDARRFASDDCDSGSITAESTLADRRRVAKVENAAATFC